MEPKFGWGSITIKYLMFIFNFVFFLSGLALMVIGGIVQGFFSEYVQFFANKYETPAVGIIILGIIIMVIAFFGCCGAKKENVYMLNTFAGLLGLVLVCEVAACITVAVLRHEVEAAVQGNMQETLNQYDNNGKNSAVTRTWDDLQDKYSCCGVDNYTDWFTTNYHLVPVSCCLADPHELNCSMAVTPEMSINDAGKIVFIDGCYHSLHDSAMANLAAISGGVLALAVVQAVGMWMACRLVKAVRERYEVL